MATTGMNGQENSRLCLGPVNFIEDFLQNSLQRGKIISNCIPEDFYLNAEIFMGYFVPHAGHLPPWHAGVF